MIIYIVAGTFDDNGGRKSSFAEKLSQNLSLKTDVVLFNGGYYSQLSDIIKSLPSHDCSVLWFVDIPNDKLKIINDIKEINNKIYLVISKRNFDQSYSIMDLVSRALSAKANLLLEFSGSKDNIHFTVLDPLANIFMFKSNNIEELSSVLYNRLLQLSRFHRTPSFNLGRKRKLPESNEISKFTDIVRKQADVFHKIIHGVNTERMLGNASFRCQKGFPSFRSDERIFISCRNIDKRYIDLDSFVEVQSCSGGIGYYGTKKPSVDSPVQLALYNNYPNINYILHSHTYIQDAPMTELYVPCGAIEEYGQIFKVNSDYNSCNFCVNLKGHGSICLVNSLEFFNDIKWIERPIPEIL